MTNNNSFHSTCWYSHVHWCYGLDVQGLLFVPAHCSPTVCVTINKTCMQRLKGPPSELLVRRSYSFRNLLPPQLSYVRLEVAISVTFQNRQSDIHTHLTQWLASCAEVRNESRVLILFFFSFFTPIMSHVNSPVRCHKYLPGVTVWKYAPLSSHLNDLMSPPFNDSKLFTPPSIDHKLTLAVT